MDPRWTSPERFFFWSALAIGLAWNAAVLLLAPGWSLDDELAHYLRSRSVWEHPALIFDAWTRIGRNLFHILPAHFGLTTARLWTLAFAGLGVVLTTRLATCLGVRRAWLIPLLLCFQPWFVELSWGVLTQTPFMLLLIGGTLGLASNRLGLSGLCFGALPLVRHEGIALTGLWVALVAGRTLLVSRPMWPHALAAIALSAVPLATYNLAAWLTLGEVPSRLLLSAKPTEIYGHGTLWHFIPISILPAGIFTIALGSIGLPSLLREGRTTWTLLFFPAYFGLHTLIYWQGLFASGGYYHFLMPMAPGLAIAALFGANTLLDHPSLLARRAANALLTGAVLQGLLLVHLWRDVRPYCTLARDPIIESLDAALAWQKQNRPHATPIICHHIYVPWREDWIETSARRRLDATPPARLPLGAIVLWDKKYADLTGLPLSELEADSDWQAQQTFGGGSVRIFEKIR